MHSKTDNIKSSAEALRYPFEQHPGPDQVVEVVPGVLWVRLKLPFRLNHVNIYLLADGNGFTAVDSGFGNEESIAAWTTLLEGPLKHMKISRLIISDARKSDFLIGVASRRFSNFRMRISTVTNPIPHRPPPINPIPSRPGIRKSM